MDPRLEQAFDQPFIQWRRQPGYLIWGQQFVWNQSKKVIEPFSWKTSQSMLIFCFEP